MVELHFDSFLLICSSFALNAKGIVSFFSYCSVWLEHFAVVCSVTWRLNGNKAGGGLVLIQSLCLFVLMLTRCIYMAKFERFVSNKVTFSLAAMQKPGPLSGHL